MGVQRDSAESAVLAFLGDGATSQGEVSESLIWAASFCAPVVFFCQNNQYAISVPLDASPRVPLYRRAAGFGFPGVRVDGNDVLAVLAVTRAALQAAREGQGPTFIEAFTYRMGAHTTSDDPTRYRLASELEEWKLRDPIARVRHLARTGIADAAFFDSVEAEADELAAPHPQRHGRDARIRSRLDVRPRVRRAGDAVARRAAGRVRRVPRGVSRDASLIDAQTLTIGKAPTSACARPWRTTPRSSSWARTSASSAAVFRITDGLQKDFGEDRVVDTPAGRGRLVHRRRPGHARLPAGLRIQFDGFVFPAYNQIVTQVAKIDAPLEGQDGDERPTVIRIPSAAASARSSTSEIGPEAYFAHTAGLKVVAVSNRVDAYSDIQQAIAHPDPIVFFSPSAGTGRRRGCGQLPRRSPSLFLPGVVPRRGRRRCRLMGPW